MHHQDASLDPSLFVQMTESYTVLKNEQTRKDFEEELRFFRQHGHLRWQIRYRVYPSTNVYVVICATVLVTMILQWIAKRSYHFKMQEAAKMTDAYQRELSKRTALGLDAPVVVITGAEYPQWSDLWPWQLILIPYRIFNWFVVERPKALEEQAKFMAEFEQLTNKEKKDLVKKMWRGRR